MEYSNFLLWPWLWIPHTSNKAILNRVFLVPSREREREKGSIIYEVHMKMQWSTAVRMWSSVRFLGYDIHNNLNNE